MANRKMIDPVRVSDKCGAYIIKRIFCGWEGASYKTTLYKRFDGSVARLCDCDGFYYKRKCYHIPALEQWARESIKNDEVKNVKG